MLKRAGQRKSSPLVWSEQQRQSFHKLKHAIIDSAVLSIADDDKPFIVHTDASDYAIGAVLSQRGDDGVMRPISFMSQKLTDVEYRWSVYEKELYSVVTALKHWSMWMMHARCPVEIHNDHASLRFLMNQPKLTAKQTRWIAFLSTYAELEFVHVRGSQNVQADALSRRADHDVGIEERQKIRSDIAKQQLSDLFVRLGVPNARINAIVSEVNAGDVEITDAIIAGYPLDEKCRKILEDPERYGYRLRWDLLERVDDGSILVPDVASLRAKILHCIHDSPTSGHLGMNKSYNRLIPSYHWPGAWLDVAEYVKSCDTCQRSKPRSGKIPGLLQPIEPQHKAHSIALDFLGPLPMTARGKNSVLVIGDLFTKRVFLEAVNTNITADKVASLIVQRVVRHQGLPRRIVCDRDPKFTGAIWQGVWKHMGTDLSLTTAFHHEANGQVEHFMLTLTNALRSYCNERGTDWDQKLIACELAYNTAVHASTNVSPIELDIGIPARLPLNLTRNQTDNAALNIDDSMDLIRSKEITAFKSIIESQHKSASYNNKNRKLEMYQVGDRAWLETDDLNEMRAPGIKKLRSRYAGPFAVVGVESDYSVKLQLPDDWLIHDVVHVSRLRKHNARDELRFPSPSAEPRASDGSQMSDEAISNNDSSQTIADDLSAYDDRGAAVAQLEYDIGRAATSRPMTRSAVRAAHDRGDRYDYLQLIN
jgi:hypothetical protein